MLPQRFNGNNLKTWHQKLPCAQMHHVHTNAHKPMVYSSLTACFVVCFCCEKIFGLTARYIEI